MKYFLSFIFLLMLSNFSFAQCDPTPDSVPISFQDTSIPLEFDFTKSESEIAAIAANANNSLVNETSIIRGLTLLQLDTNLDVQIQVIQKSNSFCGYPVSIVLKEGYDPLKVYVEDTYPETSCPFKAILEHEERHVRIDAQTLLDNQNLMKQTIEQNITNKIFSGQSSNEVKQAIMSIISQNMTSSLQNYVENRDRLNQINDSPESINGTIAECSDW